MAHGAWIAISQCHNASHMAHLIIQYPQRRNLPPTTAVPRRDEESRTNAHRQQHVRSKVTSMQSSSLWQWSWLRRGSQSCAFCLSGYKRLSPVTSPSCRAPRRPCRTAAAETVFRLDRSEICDMVICDMILEVPGRVLEACQKLKSC